MLNKTNCIFIFIKNIFMVCVVYFPGNNKFISTTEHFIYTIFLDIIYDSTTNTEYFFI